jgi:predicted secreted protein
MMVKVPGCNPSASPAATAERIQRRLAVIMAVEAVLFFGWQMIFLISRHPDIGHGGVAPGQWDQPLFTLIWATALLLLVGTGGAWFASKEVRALLGDEATRAHRRRALAAGYWATMLTALVVYAYALFEPVKLVEALHIVLSVGIAAPLARFAQLERRAQPLD